MTNSKPSECQRPIAGHRVASPSAALSPGAPCFAGPDREPRFCPPSRGTQRRGVERKPSGNQRWQLNIHHKWLKTKMIIEVGEKKQLALDIFDGPVFGGKIHRKIPWENPAGAGMLPRQQIAGPAERGSGLRVCGSQLHPIFQDQQHLQLSQRSSRMVPSASSRMAYVRSVSFI